MQLMLGHATYPGVNNVISRPIYLPVLDVAGGTTISPTTDTTVSQQIAPGETASVFVEAGTLQDRLGNEFSGVLSITEVPPELTPAALPPNLFSDTVVTIQPADMVFTTPAPLTFPNRGGWAPGTLMDLWSINPVTGQFDDVGDMMVSADGSVIETISGGIRNSSWHFPSPPPIENRPPEKEKENKDEKCNASEATMPAASSIELHSGAVRETHDLVSYQSLGVIRGLTLHYNSQQADPRPIVHFGADNAVSGRDGMLVARLAFWDGNVFHEVEGFEGGMGLTGGEHFWQLPEGTNNIHAALQADLRNLPSGVYTYKLTSGTMRLTDDNEFIGTLSDAFDDVVHVNSIDSPFGAGWELGGLQKIISNFDGTVLFLDGNGTSHVFSPSDSGQGKFDSPVGDFTTLVRNPNGTYARTFTDGTISRFDAAGRLVSVNDRIGNATVYAYDAGHLASITDPVGLVTTFTYVQNRFSTITDPAGRQTKLNYDTAGNLISITDPDGSKRTWGYDNQHHMTSETDQLGRHEREVYGFHGRATSAVRKDGSVIQISPLQTQILNPADSTSNPESAPIADIVPDYTSARTVDSNGNVTTVVLDKAGQTVESLDAVAGSGEITRNPNNLVGESLDARGNATMFSYDSLGNLTRRVDNVAGSPSVTFPNAKRTVGDNPLGVVLADLNGDGVLDLVTSNFSSNDVSILIGNGDGTFAGERRFSVGDSPSAVSAADLNGDGIVDVVTANVGSNDVSILLGNGDGTFAGDQSYAVGVFPNGVSVADLNGDGILDVVTSNFDVIGRFKTGH